MREEVREELYSGTFAGNSKRARQNHVSHLPPQIWQNGFKKEPPRRCCGEGTP